MADDKPNLFGFSDAARRISDAINQAIVNGGRGEWVAFALSDGRVEGAPDNPRTYPRRKFAVAACGHGAANYGFIKVPWDGCTPRAAEVMLKLQRQARDIGHQLVDPEVADHEFVYSNQREDHAGDRRVLLARDRQHSIRGVERRSPGGLILP